MIALLLLASALAQPVPTSRHTAESETLVELRQDLHGDTYVPLYEFVRFDSQTGNTQFVGYAGLEAVVGHDQPVDVDIYTLHARRRVGYGEWSIGRQQAATLQRRQTFDGVRYWWRPTRSLALDVWGGYARHQGLDDFIDGAGIARAALNVSAGPVLLRAGAQFDAGPGTPFVARQDLEARATFGSLARPTVVQALVAVAEPDFTVEWARLEVRTPRVGPVDFTVHARHRQAADPDALLGDAIVADLAGGALDEAGLALRLHGARWTQLSAGYRLLAQDLPGGDPAWGHAVEVSYAQPLGARLRVTPRYVFRTGPGGTYHALYATGGVDLADRYELEAWAAAVPFHKGRSPWRLAADVGARFDAALTRGTTLGVFGDVATDHRYALELRLGAALTVTLR